MNRSLLVAALATLAAGSSFAQSSITIYGRMNLTVESEKVSGTSRSTNLNNNSSRIGFKGTEDLGGGLKAGFVIEHGFSPDTGAAAGTFWGRESTVNLSSDSMGTLRLGNMPASEAYFATADYVSMHNHDTGTSEDKLWRGTAVGNLQNTIAYTSPSFSGASVAIQYGLKESTKTDNPISVAANWVGGPLHLGLGYEDYLDLKSLTLRGLYEMGAFTFGGYYERNSGTAFKRNNFRLAGMYTMGASEFHVNVGIAGDTASVDDTGAKQFTLGYNHNLSKRTKLYGYYTTVKNEAAATYFPNTPGVTAGLDYSSLAVGIRHNF